MIQPTHLVIQANKADLEITGWDNDKEMEIEIVTTNDALARCYVNQEQVKQIINFLTDKLKQLQNEQ